MSGESVSRYLARLGLKPGATMQQINAQYYFLLKKFAERESLTEREENARRRIQHGYHVLKRAYASNTTVRPAAPVRRKKKKKKKNAGSTLRVTVMSVLLLVSGGIFGALNFQNIKTSLVRFDEGDVVKLKDTSEPYGQIIRFDTDHRFWAGTPAPAYEIQLSDQDDTVWVSERTVQQRMEKIDWKP